MIASGELAPGERLPREVDLCDRFGFSRSSLREAQKMLVVAGVLDDRPGGRLTVSDMSARYLMKGLALVVPLLPLPRLLELFPLRQVLEAHATAQATARMSDAELADLVDLSARLSDLDVHHPEAEKLDQEFHLRIIRAAGDPMIGALLETIHRRGAHYHVHEAGEQRHLKEQSDRAHTRIAAAMTARDPETAKALMADHIQQSLSWLATLSPSPRL